MLTGALKILSNGLKTAKTCQELPLLKHQLAVNPTQTSCAFSCKKKKDKCGKQDKCEVCCVNDNPCKPPKPKTCYYGRPRKLAECERDPLYEYKRCLVNKPPKCPKVCCEKGNDEPPCYPEKPKRKKPGQPYHTSASPLECTMKNEDPAGPAQSPVPTPAPSPATPATPTTPVEKKVPAATPPAPEPLSWPYKPSQLPPGHRRFHTAARPLYTYQSPDQPCDNPPPGRGSLCCMEDPPKPKTKCKKICMPGCKPAQHKRCVRKTLRKFERCCKVLPPYPCFRECVREPLHKDAFQECNCHNPISVCCQDQRKRVPRPPPQTCGCRPQPCEPPPCCPPPPKCCPPPPKCCPPPPECDCGCKPPKSDCDCD